ncbi:type II toxin-antitoxin system CcdA family antitoxin [Endothiovibrio diazotrophicus]
MHLSDYDHAAPKKAANLSVNSDLLNQAKALQINLSQTLEQALAERVRDEKARRWLDENREAMAAYNRRVEEDGVFSDGLRRF